MIKNRKAVFNSMAKNDELKQQIENISQTLDISKLLNVTESYIQEEHGKHQHQVNESLNSVDSAVSSIKGLVEDHFTQENLVSMVNMAKNLVNPDTLSLLSKLNNPKEKQKENTDITKLVFTIEQLSADLHIGLDQIKHELSAISQQNSVLLNELLSIKEIMKR